ncbi:MAG: alpha/beta hydrolase, partial [Acidiferrobacterales bacterium]
VPEVAPFPAGLNDCVSGLKWVHANADKLQINSDQIIVAGESGGPAARYHRGAMVYLIFSYAHGQMTKTQPTLASIFRHE